MLSLSEENHLKSIFHLSLNSDSGVSTNSIANNLNVIKTKLKIVICKTLKKWLNFIF